MSRRQRTAAWGATLLALAAPLHGTAAQARPDGWKLVPPDALIVTGRLVDRSLAEASGAAPSRANPGLIWTIGDSGNPPDLLAVDSTGALRAKIHLQGITNTDWEDVAVGPCGGQNCVYIGDIGDNFERRTEVMLHRLVEPVFSGAGSSVPASRIESLRFRYPDRPHDVEAMAVAPDGSVLLVSKGRSGGVFAFSIPAEAWQARQPVVARVIDTLPIVPDQGSGRLITGMALSPDGRRAQVRSYRELFLFERRDDGRLVPAGWTSCDILGREPQGEGVGWLGDWRTILLSERGLFASGTVVVVECRPK